jgi:glycosyltransferase involved in cell wall biosynthesis
VRIAQISPLYESVPPRLYGGTERVVAHLTDALVAEGHDVTLFASADSETAARLVPCSAQALRLSPGSVDALAHHVLMLERVCRAASRFDILHFHIDYLHFPFTRRCGWTSVTTLHGRLDIPDLQPIYDEFRDIPVVSISTAQRAPLPQARWMATVHHGVPLERYPFVERPEGYLAFLGRISPEKRVDRAIEIGRRAGLPVRVAAKIDRADRDYYEREIAALFDSAGVEFLGEIGDAEKPGFLGGARALLFPIDWAEPFGLVMIEALACGTPVIAWRGGSVAEVIEHGVTGFIVDSIDEAVAAVEAAGALDRRRCRLVAARRFSARRMARDYVRVYEALCRRARGRRRLGPPQRGRVA